jgi:hypothetical protein
LVILGVLCSRDTAQTKSDILFDHLDIELQKTMDKTKFETLLTTMVEVAVSLNPMLGVGDPKDKFCE